MALRSPMFTFSRNAHNLFDKISHRKTSPQIVLCSNLLYHTALSVQNPVGIYGEYKNVVHWTSTISGLVKQNRSREAIDVFKLMILTEQRPNYVTMLSVVQAIDGLRLKDVAFGIHGFLIKMGFELELRVVTALIGVYSDINVLLALKLFCDIPMKDLVMWSAMISICVKNGEYVRGVELFREMIWKGVKPNLVSFVSILPACAKVGSLTLGKQVHCFVQKTPFVSLTNIQNSLIDMYAKCGVLKDAAQLFSRVQKKDVVTCKTMIRGCIANDYPKEALVVFTGMVESCFEIDDAILCDVIGATTEAKEVKFGLGLHCYSVKSGSLVNISVGTAFLQMYAKFGEVSPSRLLFDQLHPKDLIAWTSMISAYSHSEFPTEALNTFKQMQMTNEIPNEVTFVSLLQACSSSGSQELGESIHVYITKAGYLRNTYLISALIDIYCKYGKLEQGRALFDESSMKDLITWSSMINGYGLNGCADEALELFIDMLKSGIKPNDVVFVSLLSAFSYCGLEDEGWFWFYKMQEDYGVVPNLAHYACMVDLLSRRGNVQEALEFVCNMNVEPDKRIWGSLLAGCRSTPGSVDVAERAVEELSRLDPEDTSSYVVLSNLYAEDCRWDDVARVRKLIDEKGMVKTTGYSLV